MYFLIWLMISNINLKGQDEIFTIKTKDRCFVGMKKKIEYIEIVENSFKISNEQNIKFKNVTHKFKFHFVYTIEVLEIDKKDETATKCSVVFEKSDFYDLLNEKEPITKYFVLNKKYEILEEENSIKAIIEGENIKNSFVLKLLDQLPIFFNKEEQTFMSNVKIKQKTINENFNVDDNYSADYKIDTKKSSIQLDSVELDKYYKEDCATVLIEEKFTGNKKRLAENERFNSLEYNEITKHKIGMTSLKTFESSVVRIETTKRKAFISKYSLLNQLMNIDEVIKTEIISKVLE